MPEQTERAARLRPEDIVAQTFSGHFTPQSNDGWSPKARRLFLVGMALAGALLVTAGLLLTGELGPGPGGGGATPLESGPSPAALSGSLLPATDSAQPPSTPAPVPTPTTAPGPRPRTISPIVVPPSQESTSPESQSTATTAVPSETKHTDRPTTTTVPCSLLGSRALGEQLPPLCR